MEEPLTPKNWTAEEGYLSMIRPISIARIICILVLTGFLVVWSSPLESRPQTIDGLELAIVAETVQTGDTPKFRVELRNVGEEDLLLNVGVMLWDDQLPDAIELSLIDRSGKSTRINTLSRARYANFEGAAGDMIVPLPVGCVFGISERDYNIPALAPGTYFLEAQFHGKGPTPLGKRSGNELTCSGCGGLPYWVGSVTSNRQEIRLSKLRVRKATG